jgi:hypothetical protein
MRYLIFLFLQLTFYTFSQIGTGNWRMHINSKGLDIASNNEVVFTVMENGLIEYDVKSMEFSEWSKVNGLSDINPNCIYYDNYSASFYVGYKNGNIDRIQNNIVTNIPAVKLANVIGNSQINSFISYNNLVYAATGFGIVVINPSKNEVKDTYYPTKTNDNVSEIAFFNDSIFAITPTKVMKAKASNLALVDYQQWTQDLMFPDLNLNVYHKLKNYNDRKIVLIKNEGYGNDSIYEVKSTGLESKLNLSFGLEIEDIDVINNRIYVCFNGGLFIYNENFELVEIPFNYSYDLRGAALCNNMIYAADYYNSLVEYSNAGIKILKHNGPPKNSYFSLKNDKSKNKMVIAGGTLGAKTSFQYNSAGVYIFEDENWTLIDRYNQALWKDKFIWDAVGVAINPNNSNQIAIGSYCEYPLAIIEDGKNIATIYNHENSNLELINPDSQWSAITELEYDKNGTLWMLNSFSESPLKAMDKDKIFYEFNCGSAVIDGLCGRIIIDDNDVKWFYTLNKGLTAFSDGGTLSDPSDDKYIQLNEGEQTGALPSNNVTAIAMDLDNELWIGTEKGFGILNNTSNILDANPGEYNVNRIKVEFEGNVEYLLGNSYITDIEIDGGNRKWIATANSGIILLSANGNEIIQTFTTENSKIISNSIVDIEFIDITGELFIVTDVGLVSYRADASVGDDEYTNVKVFPNPVNPTFEGLITIQGIKANSDVKFTDIAGNLVYQTTSNGGTAVWNGKNLKGEKVSAGTYLIWTASNIEKGRKVGKVVVLN